MWERISWRLSHKYIISTAYVMLPNGWLYIPHICINIFPCQPKIITTSTLCKSIRLILILQVLFIWEAEDLTDGLMNADSNLKLFCQAGNVNYLNQKIWAMNWSWKVGYSEFLAGHTQNRNAFTSHNYNQYYIHYCTSKIFP